MQSEKVHFTKMQETLLVTLYIRALDSRSKNPLLRHGCRRGGQPHRLRFREAKAPQGFRTGHGDPGEAVGPVDSRLSRRAS